MIAAVAADLGLGKDNDLLFDLPQDLKFFSQQTKGQTIVMGKNTWLSLPKKLPGRHHVIISRTMRSDDADLEIYPSLEAFLEAWKDREETVWCIGGASLYAQMLPLADSLVLTEVDARVPADVYFPAFDKKEWERRELSENSENNLRYVHVLYERKSKCDTLKIL